MIKLCEKFIVIKTVNLLSYPDYSRYQYINIYRYHFGDNFYAQNSSTQFSLKFKVMKRVKDTSR